MAFYDAIPASDGTSLTAPTNAEFKVFEVSDTARANPLPLRTVAGTNAAPLVTTAQGVVPPVEVVSSNFEHIFKSGEWEWRRESTEGIKRAAVEAQASAAGAQQAAEDAARNSVAPTREAVAEALTTAGPARMALEGVIETSTAGSKPFNGARAIGRGELDYNQFSRAYRKAVIHNLPFKNPDYDAIVSKWGTPYPQAFCVDEVTNELFVSAPSPTFNIISVFDWATGAYKRSFAIATDGSVSEGATTIWKGGKRYLYLRVQAGKLSEFDITALPAAMGTIEPVRSIALNMGGNFTYRNGVWTINDNTPPLGGWRSRSNYKRMDSDFNYVRSFIFPDEAAGYPQESSLSALTPKMQGLCEGDGFFAISNGACLIYTNDLTPYAYHGIKIVSGHGDIILDSMFNPRTAMDILRGAGYQTSRLESEGVQLVNGKLVTFNIINLDAAGGLLFVEEFSDSEDALDFTPAAITWTAPSINQIQAGNFPLSHDNKLRNLATGAVMGTLPEICEYMRDTGMSVFRFYSSSVTVLDVKGDRVPPYNLVSVYNADNSQFRVEMIGSNNANGGYLQVYKNRDTGVWVQGNIAPSFRSDLTPGTDVGTSVGTTALRFKQVVTRDGVILNSPNGTAYRVSVSDAGSLSAVKV